MTVLEVIQRSTEFLSRKGVESPRLQIELMLAHVLRVPRLNLYLNFERQLGEAELTTLRDLTRRRGQREPLQHILGTVSFCGLELAVNRDVLIPRPETELLAERTWNCLRAPGDRPATVLDFGTGSGCLAIAIAVRCPLVSVHALDISSAALAVARQNAARHAVEQRIAFHQGGSFAALPADLVFDLIVSNPPYIPTAEIESLQPEVRSYDPHLALDGGADGLGAHRLLAREAPIRLVPGGMLLAEFGDGQAETLRAIYQSEKWVVEDIQPDYHGRPRILVTRWPGSPECG